MRHLLWVCAWIGCAAPVSEDVPGTGDDHGADHGDDHGDDDTTGEDDLATADDFAPEHDEAAISAVASRHIYGTTPRGQALIYYKLTPPNPNGKKAFLTFAIHGFEDAWKQDGRALFSIAHRFIERYGNAPSKLAGWTVYIVPTGNPDGMRYGTNNLREQAGAFGRCTAHGKDINRNVGNDTSIEQAELVDLFDAVAPTIAIDFHGWYNTYYGNARIGGYFQDAFNAAYTGKPAKYCYVASSGAMDCGPTRGGVFHGSPTISSGLFAEWARSQRGVPAALVEYPAPDFNLNGKFDTVWDEALGYRRIRSGTLGTLASRTFVAFDRLFATY